MKHITLKEYLKKLVDYNKKHNVATKWARLEIYDMKNELLKGCYEHNHKYFYGGKKIFQRYMDNSKWKW